MEKLGFLAIKNHNAHYKLNFIDFSGNLKYFSKKQKTKTKFYTLDLPQNFPCVGRRVLKGAIVVQNVDYDTSA